MTWFWLVVLILAAYRIARVPTQDAICHEWRQAVTRWAWQERAGEMVPRAGSWRTYVWSLLADCPLCLGVWVSIGLYAFWDHAPGLRWLLVPAAIAGAQCLLATRER